MYSSNKKTKASLAMVLQIRIIFHKKNETIKFRVFIKYGGPDRDRTGDLLRDRQAC